LASADDKWRSAVTHRDQTWLGPLAAAWGLLGVGVLLGRAIWRLGVVAFDAMTMPTLGAVEVLVCALWVALNAYLEGYRAFQKRFCPRVVARALYLAQNPKPLFALLAPAFCMGFFHARRRTAIAAWSVTAGIVALVLLVRGLPQPWRGIIDAGVVVALGWGMVALAVELLLVVTGKRPTASAELPVPLAP
jgi:hypothetical protein